ncbi:hypothetical protein HAX54_044664 [Datura stramonium]|uniref:Uncharacterized protein n=1 Tax=Datura stramonium TaxID=4076 RepID=A0ABS8WGM2_DATST|nr:hypothetical protein [Datura stramonium]
MKRGAMKICLSSRRKGRSSISSFRRAPVNVMENIKPISINIYEEMNMLSSPVVVVNYLYPLVIVKDQEKIDKVSSTCLMNKVAQACAKMEALKLKLYKDKEIKIKLAQVEEERMIFSNEASCLSLEVAELRREKVIYLEEIEVAARRESLLEESL